MASLRQTYFAFVYSIALIASLVEHASAEVKPHALIANGMVLQQGKSANIWGTADSAETVTVSFRDRTATTKADAMGRWSVQVEPQQPGGPFTMTIAGNNTITLGDVYVGDVWVASGQSNMGWPVATRVGAKELLGTENRSIRLFNVPAKLADAVEDQVGGEWQACGPDSLLGFSAVAYYFGRELQTTQQIPIGLIHASYGGSGIQQWTSAQAELKGTPAPTPPRGRNAIPATKSRLYNGMIAPLTPFSIRGVIWYQGEANVAQANDYFNMFSAMIRGWRQAWGQPELPFLFVQLAPHRKIVDQPGESAWAMLREAQLRVSQTVPNTGMAVITDWGHETEIHVRQKQPVGERLARVARAMVYHEKIGHAGPVYRDATIDGAAMVVRFETHGDRLVTKPLVLEDVAVDRRTGGSGGALHVAAESATTSGEIPVQGFTIAGEDRRFVTAQAKLVDQTVIVSSPAVKHPVEVRYGWADYPTGNLFTNTGLPASPFRTDDWPVAK